MKKTIVLMVLCSLLVAVLPGVACANESEPIAVGQYDLYPIDFNDIPNNIVPIEVNTFEEAEEILDTVAQSMTMDMQMVNEHNSALQSTQPRYTGKRYIETQEQKVTSFFITPLYMHTRYMTDGIFFFDCYSVATYLNGLNSSFSWDQDGYSYYITEDKMALNATASGVLTTYLLINGVPYGSPERYNVEGTYYPL